MIHTDDMQNGVHGLILSVMFYITSFLFEIAGNEILNHILHNIWLALAITVLIDTLIGSPLKKKLSKLFTKKNGNKDKQSSN